MATSAFFSVSCSRDVVINGVLGNCHPLQTHSNKRYNCVSEKKIGHGGTDVWYLGSLDCHKSVTVLYELSQPKALDNVMGC